MTVKARRCCESMHQAGVEKFKLLVGNAARWVHFDNKKVVVDESGKRVGTLEEITASESTRDISEGLRTVSMGGCNRIVGR